MRSRLLAALILGTLAASPSLAAARRVGAEFLVNTYTTNDQGYPSVAVAPMGHFLVTWQSEGQDGDTTGVFARRYSSLGTPAGSDFQVNVHTTAYQNHPAVASDATGSFVVAWQSYEQDGDTYGIFARRFDSFGMAVTAEFQVNTYTTSIQYHPAVAAGSAGDFVVIWDSDGQDGSSRGVFAKRFDSFGMATGPEFRVNTYTLGVQRFPSVAMLASGGFVVVWESHNNQDGDTGGIFGQRYDSAGMPAGVEFQVNTYTTGSQVYASVAAGAGGGFLVVWQSPKNVIFEATGRRFDSSGMALGPEFQIAEAIDYDQFEPDVAAEGTGGFVVTWAESFADGSGVAVVGRRIDATGTPVASDFLVNTYTTGGQRRPSMAMDSVSDLVVAWEDEAYDGSGSGIFAQRHLGRVPGLTSHASGDPLDCSDPAVTRPTFAWDPDGYEKFRISLSSTSGFLKGSVVTSGDTLLSGTTWTPSKKKWRRACAKAVAANPGSPVLFIRILGKDTDLTKRDRDRLRESAVVMGSVQP